MDDADENDCYIDERDADIDHALDHLLNRGWLYQVDDRLFITELQCADPASRTTLSNVSISTVTIIVRHRHR